MLPVDFLLIDGK